MELHHDKLLEAARFYYEKGFVPIPLSKPDIKRSPENSKEHVKDIETEYGRRIKIGKEPIPKEYQFFTIDNFQQKSEDCNLWGMFSTKAGNIGMLVGNENIVVLDCDSIPVFNEFYKDNESRLKDTPMVSTGRGYHIYVRVMTDEEAYSCNLLYKGMSFGELIGKTATGGSKMICVPPSIHITNQEYKWVHEFDKSKIVSVGLLSELGLENKKTAGVTEKDTTKKMTVSVPLNCSTSTKDVGQRKEIRVMSFRSVEKKNSYINSNIDKAIRIISNAVEGTRNSTLSRSAGIVFRMIDESDIDKYKIIESRLIAAGKKSGLSEAEVVSTIESAKTYARDKKIEFNVDDGLSELNEIWSVVTAHYSFRYNSVKGILEWKTKDGSEFYSGPHRQDR